MDFAPGTFGGKGYDFNMLNWYASECGKTRSILEFTLQPTAPLASLTQEMYENVATQLLQVNTLYGVPVFLRYGHEMNGDWNAYGNQPTAYVKSFRALAAAVRAKTNMTAMVWAPNVGINYPFVGGGLMESPLPGSVDFPLLDTNHDGVIDNSDDPYTPFYPGDDVVDWVGISLYNYPTTTCYDCQPPATFFTDYLTAQAPIVQGDAAFIANHNFYHMFSVDGVHNKPLMIPETGSPFIPEYAGLQGSTTEQNVKMGWWSQILDSATLAAFPKLKVAVNFEEAKIGDPLFTGTSVTQNWKLTNTTAQIVIFNDILKQFGTNMVESTALKFGCDGSIVSA
ncbi:hypothetical protein HDU98_001216 [Podochytrium sp. JEL0797]|nr:hypothetical protein HDU98_001216 [Podochytrium sp. JEL0797]